jgi:hypothetical protein
MSSSSSNVRVATNLSSAFHVPGSSRPRSTLVLVAVALVLGVVGAMLVVLLRPRRTPVTSSTTGAVVDEASAPAFVFTAAASAVVPAPSEEAAPAPIPPAPKSSVTRLAPTRATSRPLATTTKPTKPARTRDDDDIK